MNYVRSMIRVSNIKAYTIRLQKKQSFKINSEIRIYSLVNSYKLKIFDPTKLYYI